MIKQKNRFFDVILSIIICLLPLTIYYKAPFVFTELSILISTILFVLLIFRMILFGGKEKKNKFVDKPFLVYFAYLAIITILSYFIIGFNSTVFHNFISAVIVFLVILSCSYSDRLLRTFFGVYKIAVWICIVTYLIQFVFVFAFGRYYSFKLPFDLLESYEKAFEPISYSIKSSNISSFFSEKSHFCLYIIPYLVYELVWKKSVVSSLLLTAVLFTTASGNGIVISLLIWVIYFFASPNTKRFNTRKVLVFLSVLLIFVFLHFYLYNNVYAYQYSISNLFGSKADYRIRRGLDVFANLRFPYKLFGIGYYQYSTYSTFFNTSSIYDETGQAIEYFSAFSKSLIYSGLLGSSILCYGIIKKLKNGSFVSNSLLIVFTFISISSSVFLDFTCLLYFITIFYFKKLRNEKRVKEANIYEKLVCN